RAGRCRPRGSAAPSRAARVRRRARRRGWKRWRSCVLLPGEQEVVIGAPLQAQSGVEELVAEAPAEDQQAVAADELPGHAGAGGDLGERAGGDREVPGALALDAPGAAVAEAHLRSRALAEPVGEIGRASCRERG